MIRSYIVEHDIGFAPNPFFGVCTVACCKPVIRKHAQKEDWIVGIGSVNDGVRGKLVYAMKVDSHMTFSEYWNAEEFRQKRPIFNGSLMQAQGDNIYHRSEGKWVYVRSRHTHTDPAKTQIHVEHDTRTDRVLISKKFVYFGQNAVDIPSELLDHEGVPLNLDGRNAPMGGGRREKKFEDSTLEAAFVSWLEQMARWGYQGDPNEWKKPNGIKKMLGECY